MFQKIIVRVCFILFGSLFFQSYAQSSGQQTEQDYRQVGSSLPEFRLIDRAGITYTQFDITEDRNFFLVMFNPTCGHCVDVAQEIMENKEAFAENTVILMAGAEMAEYLPAFAGEANWEDGAERMLGVDSSGVVELLFNYISVPQINVYDHDLKLIKIFNGYVNMDQLRPYLK